MNGPVLITSRADSSSVVLRGGAGAPGDGIRVWLHGAGVIGDTPVDGAHVLARRWSGLGPSAIVADWSASARNAMCAIVGVGDTYLVLPDPLGSAIVFVHAAEGATYVSSSLPSLVEESRARGEAPAKSLQYAIEASTIANGGLTHASYEGVRRLDVFEYLEVRDGVLVERKLPAYEFVYEEDVPDHDLFEMARADVLSTIDACSRVDVDERVLHLTAGLDSRLVLSAALASGHADEFLVYTAGPKGTEDRDISDRLSGTLGLRRTHGAGLQMAVPRTIDDVTVAALSNTAGITRQGPSGREVRRSAVVLGGGYGEFLRSFYAEKATPYDSASPSHRATARSLWGERTFPVDPANSSVLSRNFQTRVVTLLGEELERISGRGVHADAVLDHLYASVRNRYHIGAIALAWSEFGLRIDPLYSVAAFKLALQTPLLVRRTAALALDLMQSFAPDLARYPFAQPRFHGDLVQVRRLPEPLEFSGKSPQFVGDGPAAPGAPTGVEPDSAAREKYIGIAAEIGAPYWQVAGLEEARSGLVEMVSDPGSDFGRHLNVGRVRWICAHADRNKAYLRQVHDMYAALTWYARD